jgi:pilus assembly protein Flp/PilA
MRGSLFFQRLLRDNRGATAIEYGLIVSLIVIAIIVAMQGVASETIRLWGFVSERVTTTSS